jgi:hypothetical protein
MALTLISTHTASASATVDITSGITSTYDSYEFHFVNMHPATDDVSFDFQVNAAGASGFNEVMTTTFFRAYHNEADSNVSLEYVAGFDQAQGTAYQRLSSETGSDNDQAVSGVLTLYAPSSTTYVKHFTSRASNAYFTDFAMDENIAGYINTTSAIDEISFKFESGNIDAGTIKMFGVS